MSDINTEIETIGNELDDFKTGETGSDDIGKDIAIIEEKSQGVANILKSFRQSVDRHAIGIKTLEGKIKKILEYQNSPEFKTQLTVMVEDLKKEIEADQKEIKGTVEIAKAEAAELKTMFANMNKGSVSAENKESEAEMLKETLYKSLEIGAVRKNGGGFLNADHQKSLELSETEVKSWGNVSNQLETKATSTLNFYDAGVLMLPPDVYAGVIDKNLREISDLIEYIDMNRIRSNQLEFTTMISHGKAQFGQELRTITETEKPKFGSDKITLNRYQYRYAIDYESIRYQRQNVRRMIEQDMVEAVAELLDEKMVIGSGIEEPFGFLTDLANSGIEIIKNGETSTITNADFLIRVIQAFKSKLRKNRKSFRFIMNSLTSAILQILKDNDGRYLLRTIGSDKEFTIFGRPVIENESMDDVGADTYPIAVANWKKFYHGVMPMTAAISLVDPYTQAEQGKIVYQFVNYFGSKRILPEACKVIQIKV